MYSKVKVGHDQKWRNQKQNKYQYKNRDGEKESMVYTFRNLLGLLESAIVLQTSTLEINV